MLLLLFFKVQRKTIFLVPSKNRSMSCPTLLEKATSHFLTKEQTPTTVWLRLFSTSKMMLQQKDSSVKKLLQVGQNQQGIDTTPTYDGDIKSFLKRNIREHNTELLQYCEYHCKSKLVGSTVQGVENRSRGMKRLMIFEC